MREDCAHFETRAYSDDGEVARFCTLGLAPEAPWKCPDNCPKYERLLIVGSDFEKGSLAHPPPVEDEPDESPEDIAAVLADAEQIVDDAEPAAIADLYMQEPKRSWWRRRRRSGPDEGDDFRLSDR